MTNAIFLVSEDVEDIQGFVCANHQTGYIWALFVIEDAQGKGHGTALHDAAMEKLRHAGHRQAYLNTDGDTKAAKFYAAKGWQPMGANLDGEIVFRLWL